MPRRYPRHNQQLQSKESEAGIEIPQFLRRLGISGRLKLGFDPLRTIFILFLAIYGFRGARNYDQFLFIHNFNLLIHEAGHLIFGILGEFIGFMGGTLMQLIVPIAFIVSFWCQKQRYAAAVCLFWLSINLFDVSRYLKDARSQLIPLLGGEAVTHDWFYLLGRTGLLTHDQTIGNFVYGIAWLLYLVAIGAGFYFCRHSAPKPKQK
ncbi:hypothetical protein Pse7367_2979 [Thalassoporum mexicanum PCC 7367]|uniref:hypothetical protein n=1 Tax=Thalassoporum mexicanum TaxID=3457544 RepID=UPI00029FAC56|nr:hypothetical protein [Pseudanabaena sp. PCC 7367]AFY71230.1 hypothetical protein Pse7367_2979 [Pseudanabaena sp. PCC 7367]